MRRVILLRANAFVITILTLIQTALGICLVVIMLSVRVTILFIIPVQHQHLPHMARSLSREIVQRWNATLTIVAVSVALTLTSVSVKIHTSFKSVTRCQVVSIAVSKRSLDGQIIVTNIQISTHSFQFPVQFVQMILTLHIQTPHYHSAAAVPEKAYGRTVKTLDVLLAHQTHHLLHNLPPRNLLPRVDLGTIHAAVMAMPNVALTNARTMVAVLKKGMRFWGNGRI